MNKMYKAGLQMYYVFFFCVMLLYASKEKYLVEFKTYGPALFCWLQQCFYTLTYSSAFLCIKCKTNIKFQEGELHLKTKKNRL